MFVTRAQVRITLAHFRGPRAGRSRQSPGAGYKHPAVHAVAGRSGVNIPGVKSQDGSTASGYNAASRVASRDSRASRYDVPGSHDTTRSPGVRPYDAPITPTHSEGGRVLTATQPVHTTTPGPLSATGPGLVDLFCVFRLPPVFLNRNLTLPVKRHRGEPGHTRDTRAHQEVARTTVPVPVPTRFRPSRSRAGVSLGLDGCEVCLCVPCARVRPRVPCVSRVCPGSPRCLFTGTYCARL